MAGFVFGGNSPWTYEQLQRQREIAQAMALGQPAPQNVGEGLSAIGRALAYRGISGRADKEEARLKSEAEGKWSSLFRGMGMGGGATGGAMAPIAPPDPNSPAGIASDTMAALGKSSFTPGDRESFITAMWPHAVEVSRVTGLDPRLVIAQAAQETGWGRSAPGNNYFGIKSHGRGGGNTFATTEYVGGSPVTVSDSFRGYGSMGESAQDYARFLTENPRYRDMLAAPDLDGQLAALGRSGYATDPNYAASVGAIARGITPAGGRSGGGMDMQGLADVAGDPMLSPGQRAVAQALLQQQMQAMDPAYGLDLELKRAQLDAARNPPPANATTFEGPGGVVYSFDPRTREAVPLTGADPVAPTKNTTFEHGGVMYSFNPETLEVKPLTGPEPPKPPEDKRTTDEREYDRAVSQGFKGTLQDWLAGKRDIRTDDEREYDRAAAQGFTGTFEDWLVSQKKAGAATTTLINPSETAYDKARGETLAGQMKAIEEGEGSARSGLDSLTIMEQQLAQPGFYSGAGGDTVLAAKKLARAFGLSPDGIDSMETFNAQAKKAALDSMGGSLGTGFSNADRDFVLGQVPTLDTSPEGNAKLIGIQKKLLERRIEVARRARAYERANRRLDGAFFEQLDQWAQANPLFPAPPSPPSQANAPVVLPNGVTIRQLP